MRPVQAPALALCLTSLASLSSCSGAPFGSASTGEQPSLETVFGPTIDTVAFEVDYATGAAPYTGNVGGRFAFDVWDLFTTNAQRVFSKAHKSLVVPTTLTQMQELSDVDGASFTTEQILAIASAHRDEPSAGTIATFYVVWLAGYFNDGTQQQPDVLGVSIGSTGVIALFKPVIESTNSGGAAGLIDAMFVEQSTLIHELGHAVGLVDNGAPLTSEHLDTGHGAHCTDTACVMYYANEGAASATAFVAEIKSGSDILFDDACLEDVDSFAAGAQ
jgi:hypothetical protein